MLPVIIITAHSPRYTHTSVTCVIHYSFPETLTEVCPSFFSAPRDSSVSRKREINFKTFSFHLHQSFDISTELFLFREYPIAIYFRTKYRELFTIGIQRNYIFLVRSKLSRTVTDTQTFSHNLKILTSEAM